MPAGNHGDRRPSLLRRIARSVPPLYWAVGAWRYLRFRRELVAQESAYAMQPGAHRNPPPMLRYRVHRSFDEHGYEEMGQVLAGAIIDCLRDERVELERRDVLDFACGPGRVIRAFHGRVPSTHLAGSDIDAEAIAWARANLGDIAEFGRNDSTPPTCFGDATFDVVYCVSLFTHLDAAAQDIWLAELARVLRPGGVLLATVARARRIGAMHRARTGAAPTRRDRVSGRSQGALQAGRSAGFVPDDVPHARVHRAPLDAPLRGACLPRGRHPRPSGHRAAGATLSLIAMGDGWRAVDRIQPRADPEMRLMQRGIEMLTVQVSRAKCKA